MRKSLSYIYCYTTFPWQRYWAMWSQQVCYIGLAFEGSLVEISILLPMFVMPSVLWQCWLGSRKGTRPVKNWVVGCWHSYLSGVICRFAYGPADATATHCLSSVKSRLVLPFWYWLTWVVPDKGPLNRCVCTSVYVNQTLYTTTTI